MKFDGKGGLRTLVRWQGGCVGSGNVEEGKLLVGRMPRFLKWVRQTWTELNTDTGVAVIDRGVYLSHT